jgi:hypothetical protein
VIARLHEAITKSPQSASLRESYAKMGALPGGSADAGRSARVFVSEIERYAKLEGDRVENRVNRYILSSKIIARLYRLLNAP